MLQEYNFQDFNTGFCLNMVLKLKKNVQLFLRSGFLLEILHIFLSQEFKLVFFFKAVDKFENLFKIE